MLYQLSYPGTGSSSGGRRSEGERYKHVGGAMSTPMMLNPQLARKEGLESLPPPTLPCCRTDKSGRECMKRLAVTTILASTLSVGADAQEPAAPPPGLAFAFEEVVTLAPRISAGRTPLGERFIIPITGGTFEGPGIKGTIMPGGWDWQLQRADGCLEVKADYFLKTDDGVIINVLNRGLICQGADGKREPIRTHPVFEAPIGKYEWLGRISFIGTLEPAKLDSKVNAVRIRFYRAT